MATVAPMRQVADDPLRLREMLGRATGLACDHRLPSVVVGMAGREGDLLFPEIVDFFASALRVDDTILRLTRERVVVMLADVSRAAAEQIVQRILVDFSERFATFDAPRLRLGYFEVRPGTLHLTVKQVLPAVFCPDGAAPRGDGPARDTVAEADEGEGF
jgi:GGDEF domain-containing protein